MPQERKNMNGALLTIERKKDEKFLKKKARYFDFSAHTQKEIRELVFNMRRIMRSARGVGLSANQIGFDHAIFVAEVPDSKGSLKFYAVFNPRIEKAADEKLLLEEGCLSVPGVYGRVERSGKVVLSGCDKNGKPIKIKAWGLLAHVFQHEVDHLHGILFTSRARETYAVPQTQQLKEREEAGKE